MFRGYCNDENMEPDNVPDGLRATGITHETSDHNEQISDFSASTASRSRTAAARV